MSRPSGNVGDPEKNLVGSNHRHLTPGRIPIGIYLGSSWPPRNWSTWEDSHLNSVVMSNALRYSDMGRSHSARGHLRGSGRHKVEAIASHPTLLQSSIGKMLLPNLVAPNLSRQQYHPAFFLPLP